MAGRRILLETVAKARMQRAEMDAQSKLLASRCDEYFKHLWDKDYNGSVCNACYDRLKRLNSAIEAQDGVIETLERALELNDMIDDDRLWHRAWRWLTQ